MPATYEFWLSDDSGRRIALLKDISFASYTRAVAGIGTLQIGLPFKPFASRFIPYFKPDWRVEVWRSAGYGIPMRNEDVFLLRKPNVYTRAEDAMDMLVFYGNNGMDLLKRRSVIQLAGTSYAEKTDFVDDMMKEIVRQQMLYGSALSAAGAVNNNRAFPEGEFTVQADAGLGPSVTRAFAGRNVYDVLKDLRNASIQLNLDDEANSRIYFDVTPRWFSAGDNPAGALQGWEFMTYAGLRGADRSGGIEFSVENENIRLPEYSISYLDEVNVAYVVGNGNGEAQQYTSVSDSNRIAASRWNRMEKVINASNESSLTGLADAGRTELGKGKPKEDLKVTFVHTEGGPSTPRSLYGVDWDLGDLTRVSTASKQFEAEISIVYVGIDDRGQETITARNTVNEQ